MYPPIGQPPFNCDFCGSRVKGDHCYRHDAARTDRVRLIDKHLGMRVLRMLSGVLVSVNERQAGEPRS
jgi:hypothetical protein